jgi:signal transduction histidine kinase
MNSDLEKKFKRRKFFVIVIIISAFILLFFLNFISWIFLKNIEGYLDDELGERLIAISTNASKTIDADDIENILPGDEFNPEVLIIQKKLLDIKIENNLENIFIISNEGRIKVSIDKNFKIWEKYNYISADSLYITQAQIKPVASNLKEILNNKFKTGYAPIKNTLDKTVGILVVDASANFFDIIDKFRKSLLIIGVIGFAFVTIFSIILYNAILQLIKTQEALKNSERLAEMGEMSARVAHEIRNPLGIIGGTAEVLKKKYSISANRQRRSAEVEGGQEKGDELFEYIPQEVRRLSRLVNDFLSFATDKPLNFKKGNINNVINSVLSGFKNECLEKKLNLEINFDNKVPEILFDEDSLKQVLLNILENAKDASKEQGNMKIETFNKVKFVVIKIHDNGEGIAEDKLKKIFEPFFTTKATGSGLGLTITKKIIEKHNGKIEIESKLNEGTSVKIYLPI